MSANDSPAHDSMIKTPQQLALVMVLAFVVPVIGILLLVQLVLGGIKTDPAGNSAEALAERVKPVAQLNISAGAPKMGDTTAWSKMLAQGQKKLVENAAQGIRGMPPKGGGSDLSDYEFERAVVFIANMSGGSLKEPPPPKPAAAKK